MRILKAQEDEVRDLRVQIKEAQSVGADCSALEGRLSTAAPQASLRN